MQWCFDLTADGWWGGGWQHGRWKGEGLWVVGGLEGGGYTRILMCRGGGSKKVLQCRQRDEKERLSDGHTSNTWMPLQYIIIQSVESVEVTQRKGFLCKTTAALQLHKCITIAILISSYKVKKIQNITLALACKHILSIFTLTFNAAPR